MRQGVGSIKLEEAKKSMLGLIMKVQLEAMLLLQFLGQWK